MANNVAGPTTPRLLLPQISHRSAWSLIRFWVAGGSRPSTPASIVSSS
jgi:hypothetical protein